MVVVGPLVLLKHGSRVPQVEDPDVVEDFAADADEPGFRSCLVVWTRKWAVELQKRVMADRQACVQEPASPQVGALFSLVRALVRSKI